MKVLADTSVWSLAFRRGENRASPEADALRRLISHGSVQMIGPIRQELLSGIREVSQFERIRSLLRAFPDRPIATQDYESAAGFFNRCRAAGVQGSNTDFLICAVASRNRWEILTTDQDFRLFAKHLPIALHRHLEEAG